MKKIIALLAIVAMGFSAKAGSVTINNNIGVPIFNLEFPITATPSGGATITYITGLTINPYSSLYFANLDNLHYATYGFYFSSSLAGNAIAAFHGQPSGGAHITTQRTVPIKYYYTPVTGAPFGYKVSFAYVMPADNVTITIDPI